MSETSDFEEIEKQMSGRQRAALHLVISLNDEIKSPHPDGNRVEVDFYNGLRPEDILDSVKNGRIQDLPVPVGDEYVTFGWSVVGKRDWKGVEEEYIVGGTPDARLIFDSGQQSLKIFANTGSFKEVQSDVERVLNKIPAPFILEDRKGFRFENDAHKMRETRT